MDIIKQQIQENQIVNNIDIKKRDFEIVDIPSVHNFYQSGLFIVKQEKQDYNDFQPPYYIVSRTKLQQFIQEGVYTKLKCGLINFCSSCYMNASIQFISHSYYLQKLFSSDGYKTIMQPSNPFKIITKTIKQMQENTILKPTEMAKLLQLFKMSVNQQADSTELTNRLLSKLAQDEVIFANQQNASIDIKQTTAIDQLCQSRIKQTIECQECKHQSVSYTNHFMLQAECKKTLKRSLLSMLQSQQIEGYPCEQCKKQVTIKKTMEITHYPQILIINLMRYDAFMRKKNNQCSISQYINCNMQIENWQDNISNDPFSIMQQDIQKHTHKLVGIINHAGSLDFGHYFYYGKIDEQWYIFDDETIQKIDIQEVINGRNAVLLMYEKIDNSRQIIKIEDDKQIQKPKQIHIDLQEKQSEQNYQVQEQSQNIQQLQKENQIQTEFYKQIDQQLKNEQKDGGMFSNSSDIIHQKYTNDEMSQFYIKKRKTKQVKEQNKRIRENQQISQKFNYIKNKNLTKLNKFNKSNKPSKFNKFDKNQNNKFNKFNNKQRR